VLIENMHDIPYVKSDKFGPEIVAGMTAVTGEVQKILNHKIPIGIQVLACGGREAIAVAKTANCNFVRNEGFVFSHIGDEGFIDSNAGDLLRYRKSIDADEILIFSDIKKKHSSHAITSDVSLLETAHAAEFFKADGVILTGRSTGDAADVDELKQIHGKVKVPVIIGSGVTLGNLGDYAALADALIIGSHFKRDGNWAGELCGDRIREFMEKFEEINGKV
jgi:uncharacterized protein